MPSSSKFPSPKKIVIGIIALLILICLWYAFRPEKLFINKQVNEAAPTQAQSAFTPLSTGRFTGEAHKTTGRATILKQPDGMRLLRLTGFSTSNGPQLHILLVDGQSPEAGKDFSLTAVKHVDLGDLKANQGDQSYQVPADVDLQRFNRVTIYCEHFQSNFGSAALEAF
jgi:hypothetical protein